MFEHPRARLEQLYEISKLFNQFQSIDVTLSRAFSIMSRTLAFRSAVLLINTAGFSRTAVWHVPGMTDVQIQAAERRAHLGAADLTGIAWFEPPDSAELRVRPEPVDGPPSTTTAPPSFLLLPLLVKGRPLFGVLQVEVGAPLDEADVAFVNAVVNHLAIALDRHHTRQQEVELHDRVSALVQTQGDQLSRERSARTRAEELAVGLLGEEQWQRRLLDCVPVALLLVEPERGQITFANRAADTLSDGSFSRSGAASEEKRAPALQDLGRRWIPKEQDPIARVIAGEQLTAFPMGFRTRAGIKALLLNSSLLDSAYGHASTALVTLEDVTPLKEGEVALQQAVSQRDEFIAIASHELRNPLAALSFALTLIDKTSATQGGDLSREWVADKLSRATNQLAKMKKLLDHLLDVSRLTSGRLVLDLEKGVDLAALVLEAVEQARLQAPLVTISLRTDPDVSGTWDRLRLQQVVVNLLSNAVKYGRGTPVDVVVELQGPAVLLSVRDHGIGIAPEDQARVFERFERVVTVDKYAGFGLGLWIAKEIVEALGGEIGLQSALGEGTTFTVRLPHADR